MNATRPPPGPTDALSPGRLRARPLAAALRLLLPLAAMVLLLLVAGGALWSGARWLLGSENGTRWLVGVLPGVQAEGLRGTLLGPHLQADTLLVRLHGGQESVCVEGLDLQGIAWRRGAAAGLWLELDIERVRARLVVVDSGPRGPRPLPSPASLTAPVRASVATVELGELRIDDLVPLTVLEASGVHFDGRKGRTHRVEHAAAVGWGLAMQASGRIGNLAPLPIELEGTVRPADPGGGHARWEATLGASGPLARVALRATLRDTAQSASARGAAAAAAAPHLDAEAELRPLEAWPLQRIVATTQGLDLAMLARNAPQTRLAGRVEIGAPAQGAPVTASVRLDNRLPGRWDERRLPLARLALELRGELERPARLEAPHVELELADARGSAGRIDGKLVWDRHALHLDAQLADVTPQRLDARAAAMSLTGPLSLDLRGLPSPDPADAAQPPPWQAQGKLALQGHVEGAPTAVAVEAEGSAAEGRIELGRLHARAGAAVVDMKATLVREAPGARATGGAGATSATSGPDSTGGTRTAGRGWRLASSGSVEHFDPLPWWPGEVASAWRRGPHRIDASWQLDVRAPAGAQGMAPLALLQSLAGSGRLHLADSVLAGVPVAADIALGSAGAEAGTGAATTTTLQARITAGGNQATIDARADPFGAGASDHWNATVQAGDLATLAPLARLHPALADWIPRQGSVAARVAAEGRWPRMASSGEARIDRLRMGTLGLARAELGWRLQIGLGADDEAPLVLSVHASGMQFGTQRADQLQAELHGTLAAHRIELLGTLPVAPPPQIARLLGAPSPHGTRAMLEAQGAWQRSPGGGGRWRARIGHLAVGPWDGKSAADAPSAPAAWAETRDLRAELSFGREGALETLQAEPGRLQLAAGAVALRWDAVQADLRGERPTFELRADVEPFALAPLLARAQPTMGWQGDLRLAAHVALKASERFDADLSFERHDGDLRLADQDSTQALGLTEFRLVLGVHDGVWDFSPRFSGKSLGEIRGTLQARTTPDARRPPDGAPITGRIEAHVADIGIWSGWVPPGWRLVGQVRTTATVGGRFGAPTYTGELVGTDLGVRNLLQGVNVSDGQMRVVLAGDSARIERFSARGGEGRVQITGGASLGEAPSARLELDAERFRVLGRVDRQLTASGHAELVLAAASSRLDGRFRLDEGLFDFTRADAPTLDDDVTVHGLKPAAGPAEPPAARAQREFALALDIDLGAHMRARGRGVDTGLRGSLRITNPGQRLKVDGSIRAEGGTYAAYGQKLDIERGTIAFDGVLDNPRLDVLAIRPNTDTRVGLLVSGTAQSPRVRLYSEPEMSESDKLSWLLLGRPSEGLGSNDAAIIQRAAVALLAGEGEAPTDSLLRTLGLDEFSLRQSDTNVRETVLSLGKQISRRLYVGYERGVNATTGSWQLIYRIAQRLTVRAQSGLENSLDVIWTWRLQEAPLEGGVRKSVPAGSQ